MVKILNGESRTIGNVEIAFDSDGEVRITNNNYKSKGLTLKVANKESEVCNLANSSWDSGTNQKRSKLKFIFATVGPSFQSDDWCVIS
jgi:hypothetical protein